MTKDQQILVAVVVGLLFVVFIYFRFLLLPINKRISATREEIDKKTEKLIEAKELSKALTDLKQYIEILKTYVAELERKVPTKPDIPELIKIISKESQNYNVKITNIVVRDIDSSANEFNEIPFSINFSTNYHDFAQFLTSIAQGRRIFSARDVILNYSPGKDTNLTGSCTILAYALKQSAL
ncbi:MAG: type 4a pilus biogenesis protein PilO [Endomicrobia bacterium]|nr:type 4a pilus biogenesis protein PilO [Endomicrobiia bacterium]MCX7941332.1 type 4a pilus biogenesis protein PilO [Endomicrobiia bacterium]MDW8055978.1 type 4a pilus biogenesis protein PilO [Elusimicrobiota bacterium]